MPLVPPRKAEIICASDQKTPRTEAFMKRRLIGNMPSIRRQCFLLYL
jgi:hypothetical protein